MPDIGVTTDGDPRIRDPHTGEPRTVASPGWAERHPWAGFLARRLGRLVLSMLVLLTATFAMIHLIPGDPVRAALGPEAPLEFVERRRQILGLDKPIPVQYVNYVRNVLRGDFGRSLSSDESVSQMVAERLPNTLRLGGLGFAATVLLAIPIGMVVAVLTREGRRRGGELSFTTVTGLLGAIPEFLLAVGLVFVFAVTLKWLPIAGITGPTSYVLPVIALALGGAATLSRIVRVEALKVLSQEYMLTARSKRLPDRLLYLRHALPNMLTSTLTLGGLALGGLVGGSVLVENVFAWPGMGTMVVQAIIAQDYTVAQASILLLGATALCANILVDFLLAVLDPRSTIREAS
jgi:peptide/nickel transport system permease protein